MAKREDPAKPSALSRQDVPPKGAKIAALAALLPAAISTALPVAVRAFPDELYQAPRSRAERAYPKLIYYSKLDKGGHFAAWEQHKLFSQELRAVFRPLR